MSRCSGPSEVSTVGLPTVRSIGEASGGAVAVKSSGSPAARSTSAQRVTIHTLTAGTKATGASSRRRA